MEPRDAEELARARLAYVSAGRPALCGPRRAAGEPEPELVQSPIGSAIPRSRESQPRSTGLPPLRSITLRHLWVAAVLVLCGVGVAVAALARSSATEVPIPVAPVVSSSAAPTPSPTLSPVVRVHVAGAVLRPGVITLPEGSIVQDAIGAAGGLSPDADPAQLNLAAQVSEGMQVIIGTSGAPQGELNGATAGAGSSAALDLNSATVAELETLPGVGPVTAGAIVAWRQENGRFRAVDELQEVSGIGPKTFEKLRPLVRV